MRPTRHFPRWFPALSAPLFASLLACCLLAPLAHAYPDRPIRFIVPYPPGGGTDTTARLIAQDLAAAMKQPVVVDNKPGANTIIGMQAIASAQPDGYTIGMMTDAHSINHVMNRDKLPFDSLRDFESITLLATSPFVLVAHPSVHADTLSELVAKARQAPGSITYASLGEASPHFLAMEWFKSLAGIDLVQVPYKGVAAALLDVVAGRVGVMFTGVSSGLPYVVQHKLKALAVGPAKGVPGEPDIAPVARLGYPEFDFLSWFGLVAPKGTPPAVLDRLNTEVRKILIRPDFQENLAKMGTFAAPTTREAFHDFRIEDVDKYTTIVKKAKLKTNN